MSVTIGHASLDERSKISGGTAGDQTKKEVCTRSWYNKPWTTVIRPTSSAVAEKIAVAMEQACANDKIGYDQQQRTTLYTQAKAVNWDLSKITTTCECDCSSLVAVCVNAAGIAVSKDIYTGNEKAALMATGKFTTYTSSEYISGTEYLKRGDILLSSGHTAVVLSDGSKATGSTTNKNATTTKKSVAEVAKEVRSGMWGNGVNRVMALKAAGYDPVEVQAAVNQLISGGDKTPTSSSGKPTLTRTLYLKSPRMQGSDVRWLQERLNELGYSCGKVDGIYGPATKSAVVKFQKAKGLSPDGQCGKLTWAKL